MAPAGYMLTPLTTQDRRPDKDRATEQPNQKRTTGFKFDSPSKRAQFGKGRVSGWFTVYVMMGAWDLCRP